MLQREMILHADAHLLCSICWLGAIAHGISLAEDGPGALQALSLDACLGLVPVSIH